MTLPHRLKHLIPVFTGLCGAGIAVVVMLATSRSTIENGVCGETLRDASTSFTYVKPLLACNVGSTIESPSLAALKKTFTSLVDSAKMSGSAEEMSIYFRGLDSGEWTSVNIDEGYTPASLMKVPVLMTYLKMAQGHTDVLEQRITVTTDPTPNQAQEIPPNEGAMIGKTYTVDELLRFMIVYSDNRSLALLIQHIDKTTFKEILEDLGLPAPENTDDYTISARLYSRFFRILYNATYLWPSDSERALTLLSETAYADGLRAGLPKDAVVAHKFGEAIVTLEDGSAGHELHDCGIVYEASEPYAMCVMTRGKNSDALAAIIADATHAAHEFVTQE